MGPLSERSPDESLRNVWRFETLGGGVIETAVETVGSEGTSPVGIFARGTGELLGKSKRGQLLVLDGELGTD
jgi:hypothetical protein